MSAMSQLMQCAEVFDREPRPTLAVTGRPEIAGDASPQTLTAIVNHDKLLPAVMATLHAAMARAQLILPVCEPEV